MVHILDSNSNGSLSCLFDDDTRFNILSLNDGVLAIEPYSETSIDTFAKKVFGCFQKGSTFSGIKTIEFVFNGIPLSIPHNVSSPEQIIQLYRSYSITTEYIAERAKYLKGESRKDRVTELVVHAVYTQKIQFKDEESNHSILSLQQRILVSPSALSAGLHSCNTLWKSIMSLSIRSQIML